MAEKECGNKEESHPASDVKNVKIVVVGAPRCGKTSFIRAFYNNHSPEEMYSDNGVRVYPCNFNFNNQQLRIVLFEIPSDPGFLVEERVTRFFDSSVCVFMYALDNPSEVEILNTRVIPKCFEIMNSQSRTVLLVGNKKDLIKDPQVLERLAEENQSPVTDERLCPLYQQFNSFNSRYIHTDCCSHDVENVEHVFEYIFVCCIDNS